MGIVIMTTKCFNLKRTFNLITFSPASNLMGFEPTSMHLILKTGQEFYQAAHKFLESFLSWEIDKDCKIFVFLFG